MSKNSKPPIKLIAGLGNPGEKYVNTRHNAGFWFVDQLARQHNGQFRLENKFHGLACRIQLNTQECWLLKPQTFMNRCGIALSSLANYYRISPEEILVAHDELDFDPGIIRFKQGGGHGGHNGLRDILSHLGSADFKRLRIGIGHPGDRSKVVGFVLKQPSHEQQIALDQAMDRAADTLPELLSGEWQRAVNYLHSS